MVIENENCFEIVSLFFTAQPIVPR